MTTAPAAGRAAAGTRPAVRGVPWVSVVLPFALLLALADQFWIVVLRTSVGSIERTADPAVSWLRESVELLPVYVVAAVVALALVSRRWGDLPTGRGPVIGSVLTLAATTTVAAAAALLASSLWDYHLQVEELVHHSETHLTCVGACLEAGERASLVIQAKAVAVGTGLLLVTNLVLVGWMTALRGRPIAAATRRFGVRPWAAVDERRLCLVLVLLGSALVHAAVVPEHMAEWRAAGIFFIVVELAQVVAAGWVWLRPGARLLALTALGSGALLALWAVSRTVGMPFGPEAWEPEPVGLADLGAGALEVAAVLLCVALLRAPRVVGSGGWSAHGRGIAVAAVVAVTVLGVGGSALPGVDLLSGTGGHSHEELAPDGGTG